jgi:hypothetical protein
LKSDVSAGGICDLRPQVCRDVSSDLMSKNPKNGSNRVGIHLVIVL